jgi:hypothetical protein
MLRNAFEIAKQQRVAWSCALVVSMFLCVFGHAPILPVIAGCLVAIGITILRTRTATVNRGKR